MSWSRTKPMKTSGSVTRKWLATRQVWFKNNPPDYKNQYQCGICKLPVDKSEVNLDHILDRSTHPELRFTLSNLQPTHYECNINKKWSK